MWVMLALRVRLTTGRAHVIQGLAIVAAMVAMVSGSYVSSLNFVLARL